MKPAALAIILCAQTTSLGAQWLTQPTRGIPRTADGKPNLAAPAPRAADGKPDFSGLWMRMSRTVTEGLKPVQPWVDALVQQRREDLYKDGMVAQCLPLGPGYITTNGLAEETGGMTKVIQTPALIVILNPDLTYRQIFMDGRALETDPNPSWMGYSVGRWEGDTLVVESNGYNDRTWLDRDGHPHTEALRVTERYRRPDFGHIELDVTLHDPTLYAAPWTAAVGLRLAADTELLEYVCNENTKPREHWVGKASDDKRSEVTVAQDILASYVGSYVEQRPFWLGRPVPRTLEITLSGGALFADQKGYIQEGKVQLRAQSDTFFAGLFGLGLEFVKDGRGVVTHVLVKHVTGDYRFERTK